MQFLHPDLLHIINQCDLLVNSAKQKLNLIIYYNVNLIQWVTQNCVCIISYNTDDEVFALNVTREGYSEDNTSFLCKIFDQLTNKKNIYKLER